MPSMELLKLIAVVLGAIGFWRLLEALLKFRGDKKLKRAETSNLYAQANSHIVDNWVTWSQKLEARVNELEGCNTEMSKTIKRQRERITELEKLVTELEKHNQQLLASINGKRS